MTPSTTCPSLLNPLSIPTNWHRLLTEECGCAEKEVTPPTILLSLGWWYGRLPPGAMSVSTACYRGVAVRVFLCVFSFKSLLHDYQYNAVVCECCSVHSLLFSTPLRFLSAWCGGKGSKVSMHLSSVLSSTGSKVSVHLSSTLSVSMMWWHRCCNIDCLSFRAPLLYIFCQHDVVAQVL